MRLLRPYLPDGTPITTSAEEVQLREEAEALAQAETERRHEAEARAQQEAHRRQQIESELEQLRAQLAASEDERS
ncbi:hypothetical protein J4G02_21475 [Candidatus Poribacteria bacterium]|nr:hypothetical protein [Candidatus Poribacteria bacterium]